MVIDLYHSNTWFKWRFCLFLVVSTPAQRLLNVLEPSHILYFFHSYLEKIEGNRNLKVQILFTDQLKLLAV